MDSLRERVQKVVTEIYDELGEVRASELLRRAEPEDSPAHPAFEWDDKKAGHEYRLFQARRWIRTVEIIIEDRAERFVHIPLVMSDSTERVRGENYYKPISVVTADEYEFDLAMSETLSLLKAMKQSYGQLKDAAAANKMHKKVDFKRADKGFALVEQSLQQ